MNFSLPAGYIMGLSGKNGAGKSTLIDYIVNPRCRYTGVIRLNGVDIRCSHREICGKIGLVSETNPFFMEKSANTNGELLGMFYPEWDGALFRDAMKKMGIPGSRMVGQMSRGERMKFQTAFAMAHHPVLYLLDEVTAGMDPVFRTDYFKILHELIAGEDASVLMTTHIQEEIERKMDYAGVLEQGTLVYFGEASAKEQGGEE